jgi:hypothetical protein
MRNGEFTVKNAMEQIELVDVNLIIFDKSKNRPAPS